jgi:hypothetical protein
VKDIRDKAAAMQEYARQANDMQLLADATEIRARAERRWGEMYAASEKAIGARSGGGPGRGHIGENAVATGNRVLPDAPTLASMGVTKTQSAKWQKLAALPEDKFEAKVEAAVNKVKNATTDRDERREAAVLKNAALARVEVLAPQRTYETIVLDPPWPMTKIERDVRPNQVAFDYPTLSEDGLRAFSATVGKMAADDCHLFMWATQKLGAIVTRKANAAADRQASARSRLIVVWETPNVRAMSISVSPASRRANASRC